MFLSLQKAVCVVLTVAAMLLGSVFGMNNFNTIEKYEATVDSIDFFENTRETAVPQTVVYQMMKDHIEGEAGDGKEKKVIVIGYDGCRLDTFSLIDDEHPSAIRTLVDDGAKAYIGYCGGVNYPAINRQMTSTAPGWCSMLTGQWANVHGVNRNYDPKSNDHLTLLTTAVEDGTIDSSAFYVSWDGHFNGALSTYSQEKKYVEDKGLNVNFLDAEDDDGTIANVTADLAQADCTDLIFLTLEYTDHCGHSTGFNLGDKRYVNAFYDAEEAGLEILNAVRARENYENEDWLIIMTTDHGGINLWHGLVSEMERMTWIITNKDMPEEFGKDAPLC